MILFVDDEMKDMNSYALELQYANHNVSFQKDVDQALEFFHQNLHHIDILILDIIMPPGNSFINVDTMEGMRTGIHFFERVREETLNLPVIILSNVTDHVAVEKFREQKNCWFVSKQDYLPFEIVHKVEEILSKSRKD